MSKLGTCHRMSDFLGLAKSYINFDWIIDVGFAHGTEGLDDIIANKILIDPTSASVKFMQQHCKKIQKNGKVAEYLQCLVGSSDEDEVSFFERDSMTGSSLHFSQKAIESFEGKYICLPSRSLASICAEYNINGSILLKLDTEGHELECLKGAGNFLNKFSVVIVEVSLWNGVVKHKDRVSLEQLFSYFFYNNFRLYDILDIGFRKIDGAPYQFDAVFIPESSPLYSIKSNKTQLQAKESEAYKKSKLIKKILL